MGMEIAGANRGDLGAERQMEWRVSSRNILFENILSISVPAAFF